jgi:uncharacterized RDD family membrane protein YckC
MICPLCNKRYPCVHSRESRAVSETDAVTSSVSGVRPPASSVVQAPGIQAPGSKAPGMEAKTRADHEFWRQEVALRVRRHRARRGRYDPNASLDLEFPFDAALAVAPERPLSAPEFSESDPVFSLPMHEPELEPAENLTVGESSLKGGVASVEAEPEPEPAMRLPRKVIRFPRYASVEPVIAQRPPIVEVELAEPVREGPRILDAPEPEATQMELLPSFADIRLDEAPAVDLCEELESIPKPAPLARRLASGAVDSGIVLFAAGLFAAIFIQIVASAPTGRLALLFSAGVGVTLWLLFQYLFLVYGGATPGMRATQLELFSLNGRRPSRFARRVRALAATLSAVSVGLGFAWALVDEDTLGWHDRISQTYLKSST